MRSFPSAAQGGCGPSWQAIGAPIDWTWGLWPQPSKEQEVRISQQESGCAAGAAASQAGDWILLCFENYSPRGLGKVKELESFHTGEDLGLCRGCLRWPRPWGWKKNMGWRDFKGGGSWGLGQWLDVTRDTWHGHIFFPVGRRDDNDPKCDSGSHTLGRLSGGKSPHCIPRCGLEKASGQRQGMSRLCWRSGVPRSLPPVLFQAARTLESRGMWVSPEELPH